MTDERLTICCADGDTYSHAKDHARLAVQRLTVYRHMQGARWWTLGELRQVTGFPEASISARLRDLRKPQFGGHTVLRRRVGSGGLFEYRLLATTIPAPKEGPDGIVPPR